MATRPFKNFVCLDFPPVVCLPPVTSVLDDANESEIQAFAPSLYQYVQDAMHQLDEALSEFTQEAENYGLCFDNDEDDATLCQDIGHKDCKFFASTTSVTPDNGRIAFAVAMPKYSVYMPPEISSLMACQ